MYRGRPAGKNIINRTIVPTLCKKPVYQSEMRVAGQTDRGIS